ncbi:MAG TPA: sulfate ABC transporter permease subunit CysT [Acetobacteraceae bacterium]
MAVAASLSGWRKPSVLPGFGPSFGLTITYLSLIVLLPLAAMVLTTIGGGWQSFLHAVLQPRALAAFRVTLSCAGGSAAIAAAAGLLIAWVLVRHRFPGRRLMDAFVDLPFALPTAVAGIALTSLYAPNGWIGSLLAPLGIRVAFTPLGIVVALTFIGLPFVVRAVQPVLQELEHEQEEASHMLGASGWQTFRRVIFPALTPALLTGFTMALARGLGEYGSVIFIAGNKPMISEIVPLLIVIDLDQFNYAGATALGTTMLLISFLLLLAINRLQDWMRVRHGD